MQDHVFNKGTPNEKKVVVSTYRFFSSPTGDPPLTSEDYVGIHIEDPASEEVASLFMSHADAKTLRSALNLAIGDLLNGDIDEEVGGLSDEEKAALEPTT